MLGRMLKYAGGAFAIQTITGLLTYLADMTVAGVLTEQQYGEYRHYSLIYALGAGPFVVGIDHALVTYVNKHPENYARFLKIFLPYGALLVFLSFAAAIAISPYVGRSTEWGIALVGPFVFTTLGYVILRSHLKVKKEFALLLAQSLAWSLGSLATIHAYASEMVPIGISGASFIIIGALMVFTFRRDLARAESPGVTWKPFAPEYDTLWQSFGPLWIAGIAFLVNTQIASSVIDGTLGRRELGMWGVVMTTMMFVQKPLQIIQRMTLPILTREKSDPFEGFKHLVCINLLFFPLLAIGLLGLYPLILSFRGLAKFQSTWAHLAVVLATSPSMAVEFIVAAVSMARGLPKNNRNAHVMTVLINVPVTWILVKYYDLRGAAISTAAYTAIFGGMMFFFTRKDLPQYVGYAVKRLSASILCLSAAIALLFFATPEAFWKIEKLLHVTTPKRLPPRTLLAPLAILIYLVLARICGIWRIRDFTALWPKKAKA